jgi:uncharacterized protein YdcH (DUF465 family)
MRRTRRTRGGDAKKKPSAKGIKFAIDYTNQLNKLEDAIFAMCETDPAFSALMADKAAVAAQIEKDVKKMEAAEDAIYELEKIVERESYQEDLKRADFEPYAEYYAAIYRIEKNDRIERKIDKAIFALCKEDPRFAALMAEKDEVETRLNNYYKHGWL